MDIDALGTQLLSLYLSIIFFFTCVFLIFWSRKKEVKWIFGVVGAGVFGGIVFYILILYFGYSGHDMSPFLRVYQTILMGGWTVICLIEEIFENRYYKKLIKRSEKYGTKQ